MEVQSGRRKNSKNWAFKITWFTKIESRKTRRRDTEKSRGREELEDESGKIVKKARGNDHKIWVRTGEENGWERKHKREGISQVLFGES
jgi:hypothetical protein